MTLVKRLVKGSELTASEHDGNMDHVLDMDNMVESDTKKVMTSLERTKLDGIEDGADVTDTANVTAAGAAMDSEFTDLAGVKGVTISTLQVKPSEGAFVDGDKTKLDGIASSANNYSHPNHTGDVTSTGDGATAIAAGVIVNADVNANAGIALSKLATQAALSVVANATNATAVPSAVAAASDHQVMRRSGTEIAFGSVNLAQSAAVTGNLPVTNGGTGRATSTTAYGLIAAGTTATGAQQTLAAGATTQILVGGGASALPAWTTATGSGAPVRGTSPTISGATLTDPGVQRQWLTSVSGSLSVATHSGRGLVTSGNVTVPTTAGFNAVIVAGGAHTVTFNSLTSAAMAAGDVMTVEVQSSTVIKAVLTAAADLVAFS